MAILSYPWIGRIVFWFNDWSELGPTVDEEIVTHVPNQIPMPELRSLERLSPN